MAAKHEENNKEKGLFAMGMIESFLEYNEKFVAEKQYEKYQTSKYPDRNVAIVACMDTRLTELLPAALGIKNGDVKLIKNAGGVVMAPFGSVMRSLLVAVYELGVTEIMIIGHYDCGVQHMDGDLMLEHMRQRGIRQESIDFLDYCGFSVKKWLTGFSCVQEAVRESVELVKDHPLIPKDIVVAGYIMDPVTGKVEPVQMEADSAACAQG